MKKYFLLSFILITPFLFAAEQQITLSKDAEGVKKQISDLFETSKKVGAVGSEGEKARQKIETSLDWDRVAKDCLGAAQWKKQEAKDKASLDQYKKLLKEVIVKTAFSRLDSFWKTINSYSIDKVEIDKKNQAHVEAKFIVSGEPISLEYYLAKKDSSWDIYDVAFEGLRYSVNINEQLQDFLKDKNFKNLLDKLRKRKEELDADAKKPKKTS